MKILEVLAQHKIIVSFAQGRRLLDQNAVQVNHEMCVDQEKEVVVGDVVQVGRKIFEVLID